jgi:hypothetical protein
MMHWMVRNTRTAARRRSLLTMWVRHVWMGSCWNKSMPGEGGGEWQQHTNAQKTTGSGVRACAKSLPTLVTSTTLARHGTRC